MVHPIADRWQRFQHLLCCPDCRCGLIARRNDNAGQSLECRCCGRHYPVRHGIPHLLPEHRARHLAELLAAEGQAMVGEYQAGKDARPFLRVPSLLLPLEPDPAAAEMDFLYGDPDRTVVLNLGGGPHRHRTQEITLNIGPFPNVDLVGDAHQIPFLDQTVDTVILKAVFEHLEDPFRVLNEIRRILKPGGLLYLDIPFLFMAHNYPVDYYRLSHSGLLHQVRDFHPLRHGASIGPISTLLLLTNDCLLEVCRLRGRLGGRLLSGVFRLAFSWFKYLDLLVVRQDRPPQFAGAYYFIGRKTDTP